MEDLEVRLVAGRMLRRGRDSQGRVGDQWRTARSLDEDEEELTMENGRTVILMLSQTHQLGPVYQYKLLHGKRSLGCWKPICQVYMSQHFYPLMSISKKSVERNVDYLEFA